MRKILAALAISAGMVASAHAANFVIGGSPGVAETDASLALIGNDFVGANSLPGNGGGMFCTSCTLTVDSAGLISVYLVGSESSDYDSLWSGGTLLANETDPAGLHIYGSFPTGLLTISGAGSQADLNAALAALIFKVDVDNTGGSANAAIGTPGFGIFYNPANLSQVFLAFDDNGANPEDNHDDLVVRLTFAVPEPATWALMILGFAGLALARRRTLVRA